MKAVSLRLSADDLNKIRHVATRLDVRDSDVIRFAIKNLLARLSPLTDPSVAGSALVPLFLEAGAELSSGLDLDAEQIGRIVNDGAAPENRVARDDLHMLAMVGAAPTPETAAPSADRRASPMRRYLYEKYVFRAEGAPAPRAGDES
jgi:hypothetical protein